MVKTKIIVITLTLILVFAMGTFVLAGVNNQNTNEEVNTNTEYSLNTECNEECDGEQVQRRIMRHVNRALQLEEGDRGDMVQRQKQSRRFRFGS